MGNNKEINIKNRYCYFFNGIINIKNFYSNLLKIDKKSGKKLVFTILDTSQVKKLTIMKTFRV